MRRTHGLRLRKKPVARAIRAKTPKGRCRFVLARHEFQGRALAVGGLCSDAAWLVAVGPANERQGPPRQMAVLDRNA